METKTKHSALDKMRDLLFDIECVQIQRSNWINMYKICQDKYMLDKIGIKTAMIIRLWERYEKQGNLLFS